MGAWFGFAAGLGLLLLTGSSVIKTLLIPRNLSSLIGDAVARAVLFSYRLATARVHDLHRREKILAGGAPTWLFAMLSCWIAFLYVGFAFMLLPFTRSNLPQAFRLSGSSLFTLGFATPAGAAPYGIVFAAAISGLGVIALMIGYMPTIYSAYNRREILVIMLEALAGKPPWGPELLARQQLIGNVSYLPRLYERWTEWAADISESHTNYRTLVYFRSPDPAASWLLSLLAVLDAAALHLACNPRSAPPEARPLLRVGYLTMRKLAKGLGIVVPDDPHPDDPLVLTREEFDAAIDHMRRAGWEFERAADEAWPHFHGWRVNYEAAAYYLARVLDVPPAVWSGIRPNHRPPPQLPVRPPHREPGEEREPGEDRAGGNGASSVAPAEQPVADWPDP
jgi:hypothetical protein